MLNICTLKAWLLKGKILRLQMTYHNVNEHIDFFFKLGEACDLNLGAWDQGWGKKNDQKLRIMSSHGIDQQHSQGEMEV